jgi:tetratricopeptide (TPR) repeat protein
MWMATFAVVAAIILTYWTGLSNPFVLDDLLGVAENRYIRDWSLRSLLFPEPDTSFSGRPLVQLSFALNYAMSGLNVRAYHVANLAIHAGTALVLMGVVRGTLTTPALATRFGPHATALAAITAVLWGVHPLNSEAVNYVTQRSESAMALFLLLTLYGSIRGADPTAANAARWRAVALVSCALGMACKEPMAVAPVLVILYDRVYLFRSFSRAWRERRGLYLGLMATWLVLASLLATGPRGGGAGFSTAVSPWTYLLNQCVMIVQYLRLAVWPSALVADYGRTLPLTLADVWPQAVLLMGLAALTALLLVRRPTIGFIGAWCVITLAPTSSVVPIIGEVGRDVRMYLPLAALVAGAVVGLTALGQSVGTWGPAAARAVPIGTAAILLVPAVALASRTVARNREYASDVTLLRTIVDRWPSARAHHGLGLALLRDGVGEEGLAQLRMAVAEAPRARLDIATHLFRTGRYEEALAESQAVLDAWTTPTDPGLNRQQVLKADAVRAATLMGEALVRLERPAEAVDRFRYALTLDASNVTASRLLADTLFENGEHGAALVLYERFLRTNPGNEEALARYGISLASLGRTREAIAAFEQQVAVAPTSGFAHRNLATALVDDRRLGDAAPHAERAVTLDPDDPVARNLHARVLALQGRFEEARVQFERSLALKPDYVESRQQLDALLRLMAQGVPPR